MKELLQPNEQLVNDMKIDIGILCTAPELEVIDNMVHTDLVNNGRKIETSINRSGSTEWKKGERSQILPSGNMVSTTQIQFPFKSRDPSGCKKYMEDNINKDIYPEDGRENNAISIRGNRGEATLECIGSEDTDIKKSKSQKRNWR